MTTFTHKACPQWYQPCTNFHSLAPLLWCIWHCLISSKLVAEGYCFHLHLYLGCECVSNPRWKCPWYEISATRVLWNSDYTQEQIVTILVKSLLSIPLALQAGVFMLLCKPEGKKNSYERGITISRAPLRTPHNILLYQSPPSSAASGNSMNLARGFSLNVSTKADTGPVDGAGGLEDLWEVNVVLEPGGGAEKMGYWGCNV